MEDEPKFEYAYRVGREIERQALHKIVFDAAKANQAANNNARFLLRSKHGYVDDAKPSNTINVAVDARPVPMVKDHGTDEEWAAQQAALVANAASPPRLEASSADLASQFVKPDSVAEFLEIDPGTVVRFARIGILPRPSASSFGSQDALAFPVIRDSGSDARQKAKARAECLNSPSHPRVFRPHSG